MENTQEQSIEQVFEAIKDIKIAMFTTIDSNGRLHSRPMATIEAEEGTTDIYFFTNHLSGKINELVSNQEINLNYTDAGKDLYVSLSGRAHILNDESKIQQLWKPMFKAWFPEGVDDPNLTLLKIEPTQAEIWDSPSNKMVQIFGIAKALVTGKEYKEGEHKKITI